MVEVINSNIFYHYTESNHYLTVRSPLLKNQITIITRKIRAYTMKVTFIESSDNLLHSGTEWENLQHKINIEQPDILITNEMPFGRWLAEKKTFNKMNSDASITAHDYGMDALKKLNTPIIISSRPVQVNDKLANEAFALIDGKYIFSHHKHYFPEEPGFYEATWFRTGKTDFNVIKTNKLNIGILLCTELMFNEWARHYRHQGAHLIAVPRATGQDAEQWKTAAAMAAIVSGCYVVSSNRVGNCNDQLIFGGKGFAFAPDGSLISETSPDNPILSFDLDLGFVENQQNNYPCYVRESGFNPKFV